MSPLILTIEEQHPGAQLADFRRIYTSRGVNLPGSPNLADCKRRIYGDRSGYLCDCATKDRTHPTLSGFWRYLEGRKERIYVSYFFGRKCVIPALRQGGSRLIVHYARAHVAFPHSHCAIWGAAKIEREKKWNHSAAAVQNRFWMKR